MEARAQKKYLRMSPRKMRLVVDMIRGKSASEAFNILRFSPQKASVFAEQLLRSAISNLSNKEDGVSLNNDDIVISKAYVDQAPTIKRIQPAPMGRAYRIRKRSNHLTIVVETKD